MGICLSCLKPRERSDSPLLNEQTPLLTDSDPAQSIQAAAAANPPQDRVKREEILNDIIQFTGENLIDVTSVSQPEVRTVGKGANEYKRILAELKYVSNSTSTSPTSTKSNSVNNTRSLLPRASANSVLSDEDKRWLDSLSAEATKALENEPVVKPVGTLVLNFQD